MPDEPIHPRSVAQRWEPERPGARRTRDVSDPIVEPEWGGARVVAAITRDEAAIYAHGAEVPAPEELLRAILDAFRATDAVVAGNLTTEAFRTSRGVYPAPLPVVRQALLVPRVFRQGVRDDPYIVARDQAAAREAVEPLVLAALQRGERHAFVATDLLLLDGQPIDEVPLLERKRLLETILQPSELVRVSVFVKPAARLTLATWGMLGFELQIWRSVNSRYLAGLRNPDVAVGHAPVSRSPAAGSPRLA